jgi:transcriptional regulator with XRE-family HTH domain
MGDATHLGTGFARRLRELRTGAGLSQAALARKARMSATAIAKLEQGVREPSWATVIGLAAALSCRVDAFLPGAPCGRRSAPTPPAKVVRPGEGRLDPATALLRVVQDAPSDLFAWGVLADWLGDRGLSAEILCRRRIAIARNKARVQDLPRSRFHRERRRRMQAEINAEAREIEARYGRPPTGDFRFCQPDVLWMVWGDPGTSRACRAALYLHYCRTRQQPRALIAWLTRILPQVGGQHYRAGLDICERYAAGADIPAECPESARRDLILGEGRTVDVAGDPGHVVRSPAVAVADIVDAIYSPDPVESLYPRGASAARCPACNLESTRPGPDALDMRCCPFPPPD